MVLAMLAAAAAAVLYGILWLADQERERQRRIENERREARRRWK